MPYCARPLIHCREGAVIFLVTSQGERVPQSMEIQHFQANINYKGDMSNFLKKLILKISSQIVCVESSSHT